MSDAPRTRAIQFYGREVIPYPQLNPFIAKDGDALISRRETVAFARAIASTYNIEERGALENFADLLESADE